MELNGVEIPETVPIPGLFHPSRHVLPPTPLPHPGHSGNTGSLHTPTLANVGQVHFWRILSAWLSLDTGPMSMLHPQSSLYLERPAATALLPSQLTLAPRMREGAGVGVRSTGSVPLSVQMSWVEHWGLPWASSSATVWDQVPRPSWQGTRAQMSPALQRHL